MDSCIVMDLDTGIKCVAVGDGEVGKTCMLVSYSTNEFPTVHVPTIFDNYAVKVVAKGESYTLMLFDTAGQEDYDRLRLLAYPGTDAFLLCFSVVAPSSFENVTQRWVPELRQHCPNAAILLVGTQCDLRQDTKTLENLEKDKEAPVPRDKAIRLAKKIGAVRYVECSALTREGLKGVFDQAILSVIDPPVRRFKGWRKLLCSAGVKG